MANEIKADDKLDFSSKAQSIDNLKKPKSASGGSGRAIFWALIALLLMGAAVWWLFQSADAKKELRQEAAATINNLLKETPAAGMGNLLLETPPTPPLQVTNPPTDPGTLAGRLVEGPIGQPGSESSATQDVTAAEGQAQFEKHPEGSAYIEGENSLAAKNGDMQENAELSPLQLTEDKSVPPAYLAELANWLANRYQASRGQLGVSAQSLNHYGAVTLVSQTKGGRAGFLRYTFQPSMLEGLYKLYIERFMSDLNIAAEKKGFSEAQNRQFHMALAGKAVLWAAGLEGVLKLPDLKGSLKKIDELAQKTVELNMQLTNTVFELDELRENRASSQQINTVQMRVDGLASRYRRATQEHENAQRQLAQEIRKNSGQGLDQETLLFMAAWAERRMNADEDGMAALSSCVTLLRDLGRRCAKAGSDA